MCSYAWTGSRWWKFDFHTHTPASSDFGKGEDQSTLRNTAPKDWLLSYMRAGIDCIAITDHNSGEWIDKIEDAYQELSNESHSEFREIFLFPGIEVTVQGNIHLLAIFPQKTPTSTIDSFLGAIRYRRTKGDSNGCTEASMIDVIGEIMKMGAIAVPAHVDKARGLFNEFEGNSLDQVLDCAGIIAMEVHQSGFHPPQPYLNKKLSWTPVLGTDSHHLDGQNGPRFPGSHYTWVKMSEPTLDGLRLALIDGALSVRRSDEVSTDQNVHSENVIESITVDNAKYFGRNDEFKCTFNPWYNAIIGGRGTGKSTLIEFTRLCLNRFSELDELEGLAEDFKKYREPTTGRDDNGLLKDNTDIEIVYRKQNTRYKITFSQDTQERTISVWSDGSWSEETGSVVDRFPIRMFSQKQLYEIARKPQALLKVIDEAEVVEFERWSSEMDAIKAEYKRVKAEIRQIEAGLDEESKIKGQLEDVKRKLTVIEQSDHAEKLKNYQKRKKQQEAISRWEDSWKDSSNSIRELARHIKPADFDEELFPSDLSEAQELMQAAKNVLDAFGGIETRLVKIAEDWDGVVNSWNQAKQKLEITNQIAAAITAYEELQKELEEAGVEKISEYEALVQQRLDIEKTLNGFKESRQRIGDLKSQATHKLDELRKKRAEITESRKAFLRKVLDGNEFVRIEVLPYLHEKSYELEIRELLNLQGRFDKDVKQIIEEYFSKKAIVVDSLSELKNFIHQLHDKTEDIGVQVQDGRFASSIQGLQPELIDDFDCWYPEDSLNIEYSLKDTKGFKSVEQGSPGQKTAALLAFILSYGEEPLILDQPEDDLDNHLIYDLIVSQIRTNKLKRQVLVVTHNANIVVNGDAENVVVLDICNGLSQIAAQGSLQDSEIRAQICQVMEGGKEAFEQRYKRIKAGRLY